MNRPESSAGRPGSRFLVPAIIGATVVVVAGIATQLVNYAFFGLQIRVLDSSTDGGAFGFVGDLALAGAAGAGWFLLVRTLPVRAAAVVALPPLLTFLAVDKAFRLHDHVAHYLLFYAPLLAGTLLCLVVLGRRVPRSVAPVLVTGLTLLCLSFALHLSGERLLSELGLQHAEAIRQVKVAVKHGCEVQGWLLIAIGLAVSAPPARRVGVVRGTRAEARGS